MVGPLHAQGAAESDASVCLQGRSHVPGRKRGRAQADEAGIRKAKPPIETPSVGIRRWAVFQKGLTHEPPPENLGRERDVVGIPERQRARAYVYAPEPPLCICSRAGTLKCEGSTVSAEQGGLMAVNSGDPG